MGLTLCRWGLCSTCLPFCGVSMEVTYRKFDPDKGEWSPVTSLDEIPAEALPHVFGLRHNEDFECEEPLLHAGTRFRAIWAAQDLKEYPFNPMAATLCLRLQQAELDKEYWKEQVGNAAEKDARFKKVAGTLRDRIVKQLAMLATSQAEAFAGSHNERHQKLAAAMTQIPAIVALCDEIPNLLTHTTNDIPF
jgi:hypothetical protein